MNLNIFFWEGVRSFHQTLKEVNGPKRLRTPGVDQDFSQPLESLQTTTGITPQIRSLLPHSTLFPINFSFAGPLGEVTFSAANSIMQ